MILGHAGLATDGPRSSLLPSSIQLLRCTAEGGPRREPVAPGAPAVPLVGGLVVEHTDQGAGSLVPDTRRRLEDQPANRRTSVASWDPEVVSGGPELFICRYARTLTRRSSSEMAKVVETRRLELLTLSLQRRCSSS